MTVFGAGPRGWVVTIAHLVYLPAEAVDLAHAGDDARKSSFSMSVEVPVFARCRLILPLTTTRQRIHQVQGRLDWNPTFSYRRGPSPASRVDPSPIIWTSHR